MSLNENSQMKSNHVQSNHTQECLEFILDTQSCLASKYQLVQSITPVR